ncbi:Oxalate:formate exchange protein [Hartmannibacter diazotrophicus]|uniref:Oxalate:formate exchange protein n=1 Tax=Hartmannibacter diazotrophicus TaxID=1482074 RepID=A0A2C9DBS9_9HYPH|nr:oxalate/formate MFS antiporter [Hartmannibacter diazotrophicus]SON57693.1 Oxalate:formate exchange protein [Hartmannibacter diazotrophicus]
MTQSIQHQASAQPVSDGYRWGQLAIGVVCMVMIANLQYGWTFFVPEIKQSFGWSRSEIQWAFTLFVLFETWLVPVEGWFVDKFGPKIVILIGGVLCGAGWVINSMASDMFTFCLGQVLAGIGAGSVYGTCVGNALKWFPDKRGLASGITAAGFGAGSALTVWPIQATIANFGYQHAFLWFGLGQGIIIVIFSFFLYAPKEGQVPEAESKGNIVQSKRQYTPQEVVKHPMFWLMYAMFVMVGSGGLVVTANLAPMAKDLGVADMSIAWGMTALTLAATIDRVLNGVTRPFFGWISDKIGRENTMFIAFAIEAIGIYLLYLWGHNHIAFVILSGTVFFAWGEIYSLFPSTCTDTFGSKFAATNAGLLYTAKGTAALLVPFGTALAGAGNWGPVFIIGVVLNALTAFLAIGVLKPWRRGMLASNARAVDMQPAE